MQTLTPSLYPCYAASDRPVAEALAGFLERGADVRVFLDEGMLPPGGGLAAKAREARVADRVLILFSHRSLPRGWQRREWEPALVTEPAEEGVPIAFATCDDCAPPRVLVPRFDLTATHGFRQVKRWLRGGDCHQVPAAGDVDSLGAAIADRPGRGTAATAECAAAFAQAFHPDFDAILLLECAGRSLAALAGDLAHQLGLRLEGSLEDNLERLAAFCAARRFLIVLADPAAPAERLVFGGQCSTLLAPGPLSHLGPAERDEIRESQQGFREAASAGRWTELCGHARKGLRLAREQGRIAECYELMKQWFAIAEDRGDIPILDEASREMVWILEGWGRVTEAQPLEHRRRTEFGRQLALF